MIAFWHTLNQAFPDRAKHGELRQLLLELFEVGERANWATGDIERGIDLILDEPGEWVRNGVLAEDLEKASATFAELSKKLTRYAFQLAAMRALPFDARQGDANGSAVRGEHRDPRPPANPEPIEYPF